MKNISQNSFLLSKMNFSPQNWVELCVQMLLYDIYTHFYENIAKNGYFWAKFGQNPENRPKYPKNQNFWFFVKKLKNTTFQNIFDLLQEIADYVEYE